mmetsp:Transcript_19334/g.27897  ORF Transcript_19334/g.27897 Transcript_19334/m.27897 type:complete len:282 (-) Transcript_19334:1387-2232(-)
MTRPTSKSTSVTSLGRELRSSRLPSSSDERPRRNGAGYCSKSLARAEGTKGTNRCSHLNGARSLVRATKDDISKLRRLEEKTTFCSNRMITYRSANGIPGMLLSRCSPAMRSNSTPWFLRGWSSQGELAYWMYGFSMQRNASISTSELAKFPSNSTNGSHLISCSSSPPSGRFSEKSFRRFESTSRIPKMTFLELTKAKPITTGHSVGIVVRYSQILFDQSFSASRSLKVGVSISTATNRSAFTISWVLSLTLEKDNGELKAGRSSDGSCDDASFGSTSSP